MTTENSLKEDEPHPAAYDAKQWISDYLVGVASDKAHINAFMLVESLASVALSGNRMAEICLSTLQRLLNSQPVSDRYVLGLAWFLRNMQESTNLQEEEAL